jgi:HlyD family secretion protein
VKNIEDKSDIYALIGMRDDQSPLRSRLWVWIGLGLAALAMIFGVSFCSNTTGGSNAAAYLTTPTSRADLTVTVTATGTTQPRNEVSVGIEVSGTIAEVFVDHNDSVVQGELLAGLDTTILSAQAAQADASLQVAKAAQQEAEATVLQTESELARMLRLRDASGGVLPSEQDLDATKAARDRAVASVKSAEAQVAQAEAQLAVKQTELAKAQVISPIDGIVLSRRVDPGQTVAATLQTPELFVIAEDLTEMELRIEIDEADVGQVRQGQPALFTVDAYPDEEFAAEITQVRYAPISSAGVVTYEAILSVDNSDMRLRPGMTATALIRVEQIEDALLVPNAALRFSPSIERESDGADSRGIASAFIPRVPTGSVAPAGTNQSRQRIVWVVAGDDEPRQVTIGIGATDGMLTQVLSGSLEEGMRVIVEEVDPS